VLSAYYEKADRKMQEKRENNNFVTQIEEHGAHPCPKSPSIGFKTTGRLRDSIGGASSQSQSMWTRVLHSRVISHQAILMVGCMYASMVTRVVSDDTCVCVVSADQEVGSISPKGRDNDIFTR
jgi:hypothetical protein